MSEIVDGLTEDVFATLGEIDSALAGHVERKWLGRVRNGAIAIGVIALGTVFEGSDKMVLAEAAGAAFTVAAIAEVLRR